MELCFSRFCRPVQVSVCGLLLLNGLTKSLDIGLCPGSTAELYRSKALAVLAQKHTQ